MSNSKTEQQGGSTPEPTFLDTIMAKLTRLVVVANTLMDGLQALDFNEGPSFKVFYVAGETDLSARIVSSRAENQGLTVDVYKADPTTESIAGEPYYFLSCAETGSFETLRGDPHCAAASNLLIVVQEWLAIQVFKNAKGIVDNDPLTD